MLFSREMASNVQGIRSSNIGDNDATDSASKAVNDSKLGGHIALPDGVCPEVVDDPELPKPARLGPLDFPQTAELAHQGEDTRAPQTT